MSLQNVRTKRIEVRTACCTGGAWHYAKGADASASGTSTNWNLSDDCDNLSDDCDNESLRHSLTLEESGVGFLAISRGGHIAATIYIDGRMV